MNGGSPKYYEFADFRIDVEKRALLLKADNRALPLSARAFDALLFLVERPGQLVLKATLMQAVWPNVVVEENNLNQQISAVRRILGERPEEHRFIVTEPGRGYRFVAPVTSTSTEAPAAAPVAQPLLKPRARPMRRWIIAGVGGILVVGLAWFYTQRAELAASLPAATSVEVVAVQKPRLAVLPFENLSPDPANAFFADGLHALSLVSREDNAVIWNSVAAKVARVDAWCGDAPGAVGLLEQLANGRPGLGPAVIARDPLFAVPLANAPAYQALAASLESKMRETPL
ncbi:MAG TPA: winged helix-turn-helix domain-containing protein [Steroidobacteraceae bacterium]|nr:winged helix-turn-helix domain-containing protein [Steroidobacteraceae bacterium]